MLLYKLMFMFAVSIVTVHGRCNLTSQPFELIDCMSYFTRIVISLARRDIDRVCQTAGTIAQCTKAHLSECIGQQIGDAVLNEVITASKECCPDHNKMSCPYRDEIWRTQRCFSADSLVTLTNGNRKTVAQLRSGDSVLAFNHDTKTILPTQLITMLDFQPQRFALFKHITTASGRQLSLSSSHLLFTTTDDYIMAKDIRIGMEVLVMNENNELINDLVSNVSDVVKQGYIAPLTVEGTMIVNDVAASCYSTIKSHRIAHAVLSPMRFWYHWFGSEQQKDEIEEGIHWFPKMIYEATTYILPSIIQG